MAQEDELQALEKERTVLLKKLRIKALERGERAAKEGVPVEKLAALEEMQVSPHPLPPLPSPSSDLSSPLLAQADLGDDEDFEGITIGAARLQAKQQNQQTQQALAAVQQAISSSFANVSNVEELRRRGTALQAELAPLSAALAADGAVAVSAAGDIAAGCADNLISSDFS